MFVGCEDPCKLYEKLERDKKVYAELIMGGMEVEDLADLWGTIFVLERRTEKALKKISMYEEDFLLKGTA